MMAMSPACSPRNCIADVASHDVVEIRRQIDFRKQIHGDCLSAKRVIFGVGDGQHHRPNAMVFASEGNDLEKITWSAGLIDDDDTLNRMPRMWADQRRPMRCGMDRCQGIGMHDVLRLDRAIAERAPNECRFQTCDRSCRDVGGYVNNWSSLKKCSSPSETVAWWKIHPGGGFSAVFVRDLSIASPNDLSRCRKVERFSPSSWLARA